ncbi:uncharacterized protein LOC105843624 [Hydra vulgaris]|uniref:uncharacterized protein LOC105843624 n=1 Tax=Hydra vulgaris TaxID=6087 RepID=UPI0032E9EE95
MLVINNKGYKRKHVVGGSGLFNFIKNMFSRQALTNALKASKSLAVKAASSDLGKTAVGAAKSAGKELATSAISTAKDAVINKGKKIIESKKAIIPSVQIKDITSLTPENKQGLKNLIDSLPSSNENERNINNLLMGSSYKSTKKLTKENKQDLNSPGALIQFVIGKAEGILRPSEFYLMIEGRLLKADGTSYANSDAITLANNGIMHLFQRIDYQLSNEMVEQVNFPGQATTMLGILKYTNDFQLSKGMNQLWHKDSGTSASYADNLGFSIRQSYIIQKPTAKGSFSFYIPLRHIFGFCDDYDKVLYGLQHTITFTRKSDDSAIYRASGVAAGKVVLSKMSIFIPRIEPSLINDVHLKKIIAGKDLLQLSFRSRYCEMAVVPQNTLFDWNIGLRTTETPRYVIVGFQTNKDNDQTQNPSSFDHCDLQDIWVELGTTKYPYSEYSLSFPNMQFLRIYEEAISFANNYYNVPDLIQLGNMTSSDYRDLYPIMVFDISNQDRDTSSTMSTIYIKSKYYSVLETLT